MSNYLWLIYALLAAITAALVALLGKIGLQSIDVNIATAIRSVIMALFLIGVVIIQGNFSKIHLVLNNKKALLFIILSGIVGALSWLFYFLALKYGKVSQVVPIDRSSVVIASVLAIIFLGEKLSFLNQIGIFFITIGVIFAAFG